MKVLIFGAGKIARGFVGHILWQSDIRFSFIESKTSLVEELNSRRQYTVRLLGETIREETVSGFDAYSTDDTDAVARLLAEEATLVFVSVGGKNLPALASALRVGLARRWARGNAAPLDIVLCENWINPAGVVRDGLYEGASGEFSAFLDRGIGVTESVVMRSAIEPDAAALRRDPLAVNVQDYRYWPINGKGLKGTLPPIKSVDLLDDFGGYLDKKFYTYNAANGTVAYLGSLKGYTYISEAAHDPEILAVLMGVYRETGLALCKKHGFPMEEQMKFARTSLEKLQNKYLVDYLERNARDPLRKLGPKDRLIGPARLVVEYGGLPSSLATAIAAAIYYTQPSDPFAEELRRIREEKGVDFVLDSVCELGAADEALRDLIVAKIAELKDQGWIRA